MLKNENIQHDDIKKLHDFHIHAHGHYVVITAKTINNNNYTFMATASIIKYILYDMNQIIVVGPLSNLQFANIMTALKNMSCGFKILSINNKRVLASENLLHSYIEKLHEFNIHAHGDYVVITAKSINKSNNYTFMATASIIKYILCDMNQIIVVGSLSRAQFENIMTALEYINCGFKMFSINNKMILVSNNKIKDLEKNKLKVKVKKSIDNIATSLGE